MYVWAYLDGAGEEIGRSPRFAAADEAEDWIGSSWPELLENGVLAVVLVGQDDGGAVDRVGRGAG